MMTTPPNHGVSRETALLEYVERLRRHTAERLAIHVHLSRLQAHHRREHHIRMAIGTFEEFVSQYEGQIFLLSSNDIIFVARGVSPHQLDDAVTKLRYLFSEDPLTQFSDEHDSTGFCTWYRLDRDYPEFLAKIRHMHHLSTMVPDALNAERKAQEPKPPLRPVDLAQLIDALKIADLSNLIRNQAVCAFIPGQSPRPVFHELYVSIDDLGDIVAPNIDLTADPWLFQYLTQTLDRRMLSYLAHEGDNTARAFSLNLNIATMLSPEFQRFDKRVSRSLRGRLVIELQKIDIFADMGAFRFARDYAREHGYRICIDGLTHMTMPYIDREKLGCDLIKMYWSPEIVSGLRPGALQSVKDYIEHSGVARVILCRCDSEQSLEVGRSLGITLFQGRYVETLLSRQTKIT